MKVKHRQVSLELITVYAGSFATFFFSVEIQVKNVVSSKENKQVISFLQVMVHVERVQPCSHVNSAFAFSSNVKNWFYGYK